MHRTRLLPPKVGDETRRRLLARPPPAANRPTLRQTTIGARLGAAGLDIGGWVAVARCCRGEAARGLFSGEGREVGARSKVGDEPGIEMIPRSR